MFSHHLDITIIAAGIAHELHARLLTVVHARIKEQRDTLAVSWPDWKQTPGEFGYVLRVFGDRQALTGLSNGVRRLQDAGLIRTHEPTLVPVSTASVTFLRDRQIDSLSPSRRRRLDKRSAARGETKLAPVMPMPDKIPHFLKMQSVSTAGTFHLYVSRTGAARNVEGGHQYGLGYTVPDF